MAENESTSNCHNLIPITRIASMNDERRVPKTKYNNVVRESDIAMDPDYLKKKEFFDNLQLRRCLTYCRHSNCVVELKCNALRENTEKETKVIQNSLTLLISQLPSRVQKMKVVVLRVVDGVGEGLLQRVWI